MSEEIFTIRVERDNNRQGPVYLGKLDADPVVAQRESDWYYNTVAKEYRVATTAGTSPVWEAMGGGASLEDYTVENVEHAQVLDADSPTVVNDMINLLGTIVAALNDADLMPGAPTMGTPTVDSQSRITTPWTAPTVGSAAVGYVLQSATNASFTANLTETTLGNVLTYQSTRLTPATLYYFRVSAIDASGNRGPWSTAITSTTSAALPGPSSIASIWAYYEAETFALDDGDTVATSWTDQSGNGRHGTVVGTPIFRAEEFDSGKPSIDLPQFQLPSMAALTAGDLILLVKLNSTSAGGGERAMQAMGGDTGNQDLLFWNGGTSIFSDFGSTVRQNSDTPGAAVNDTDYHVVRISAGTNSWRAYVDGVAWSLVTTNTVAFRTTPQLGYFFPGSNYLNGRIAAAYIFSSQLSAPEWATMQAYIAEEFYL